LHCCDFSECLFGFSNVTSLNPENQRTPMHIAGRYNHPECIAPLLDAGAELDALDAASNTPLSLAAWQNHCEVIQQFVLMGANVDLVIDSNRKETIRTCGKEFNISKLLCQP